MHLYIYHTIFLITIYTSIYLYINIYTYTYIYIYIHHIAGKFLKMLLCVYGKNSKKQKAKKKAGKIPAFGNYCQFLGRLAVILDPFPGLVVGGRLNDPAIICPNSRACFCKLNFHFFHLLCYDYSISNHFIVVKHFLKKIFFYFSY